MNLFRQVWRALLPHRVAIKPGDVFELIGSRDDPFRGHYSVAVERISDDGNWIEYRFRYGTVSSMRRDVFVSTYQKACPR